MQRTTDCGVPRQRVDIDYKTPTSRLGEHHGRGRIKITRTGGSVSLL